MWPWAVVASAQVAPVADPLSACCAAVGGGACPRELSAVGPGSTVSATGAVRGLWRLSCTGGSRFDAAASMTVSPAPGPNAVLTPVSASVAACYRSACALPQGLCVASSAAGVAVVSCADGLPPTDGMWRNPPASPQGAVFVGGRMLGSQVHAVSGAPPSAGGASAPASAHVGVETEVPPAPPSPCVENPALRTASNQQVDEGNAAVVAGQVGEALDRYRAALVMNQCNPYAWTALGDGLLQLGNAERARAALVVATRLMPSHFHAWTSLGQAEERLGDAFAARRAYQQALAVKPGYAPAVAGLARVGG